MPLLGTIVIVWASGFALSAIWYLVSTPTSMIRDDEFVYQSIFWWIALPIFIIKSLVLGIYDQVKSR